jgi:hypothetical protein
VIYVGMLQYRYCVQEEITQTAMIYCRYFKIGLTAVCLCVEYTVSSYSFVAFSEFDVILYETHHTNSYPVARSETLLATMM